ncbi:hypothetical protein METSCH_F05250 [Metschnikowia aff. pulcherrima]|uniref:Uncharacterized protein n=1 Tax=Metschnikowia aff. pulcherrima TaxID=2163413 RepID=A0A4P6XWF0_9ASCO|nr:hypothetical protein METSCH_F05250 [Metschnikowia aff. pulcherrima]
MSDLTRTVISLPARKRRRVLEDIGNNGDPNSPGKTHRKSLGFDLVSIPATKTEKDSKGLLEKVINTDSDTVKPQAPADMNTHGSSIPTIRRNDRIERFLSINESLNRKSSINAFGDDLRGPAYMGKAARPSISKAALDKLVGTAKTLDSQIYAAKEKLSYTQEEAYALRKLHRALQNEYAALEVALDEQKAKFEYVLQEATKSVEKREKEVENQLKEYERKSLESYESLRAEISKELESTLALEDPDTKLELQLLELKKVEAEEQLKQTKSVNAEKIREEQEKLKLEKVNQSRALDEEVAAAEQELELLELENERLDAENDELHAEILAHEQTEENAKKDILKLERNIQEYVVLQKDVDDRLRRDTDFLKKLEAEYEIWKQKEANARAAFEAEDRKYKLYLATHRRLEHAIAKLGSRNRILVRVRDDLDRDSVEKQQLGFDKVDVIDENGEYARNWEYLVQEALLGVNVSLLFLGLQQNICEQLMTIFAFLRLGEERKTASGWKFSYHFQSIHVQRNGELLDLLNLSTEVETQNRNGDLGITSQKMLLKNVSEIPPTIRNKTHGAGTYLHMFTVESSKSNIAQPLSGSVVVVDLTGLTMTAQKEVLETRFSSGFLGNVIRKPPLDHTSMDVCEIGDLREPESQALLAELARRVNQ